MPGAVVPAGLLAGVGRAVSGDRLVDELWTPRHPRCGQDPPASPGRCGGPGCLTSFLEGRRVDQVLGRPDALVADSVGLAMLVVLDSLNPAERLAFVLHDTFAVPFEDIAAILGRSQAAAKLLASRARRRVREAAPAPDPDVARQRRVVDAFLAASRRGDFEALVSVLAPDVLLRVDRGVALTRIRGAAAVAGQALSFARFAYSSRPVLINGAAGVVSLADDRPVSLMSFTIVDGVVAGIDIFADPDRLRKLIPA